jgi:ribosomal protein L21
MSKYAVCSLMGKQIKVLPDVPFLVGLMSGVEKIDADVLFLSDGDRTEIGRPFLKNKIVFDVLGVETGKKIRVAKFHAKANFRRVSGIRPKYTKLVWKS